MTRTFRDSADFYGEINVRGSEFARPAVPGPHRGVFSRHRAVAPVAGPGESFAVGPLPGGDAFRAWPCAV